MPDVLHSLGGEKNSSCLKPVQFPAPWELPGRVSTAYLIFNFAFYFYFCILLLGVFFVLGFWGFFVFYSYIFSFWSRAGRRPMLCVQKKALRSRENQVSAVLWAPTFGNHTQRMKQAALLSNGFSRTWLPLSWTGVDLQFCSESLHCAPWR